MLASDLPPGWAWTSLETLAANEPHSIADGPFGSKLKTSHYQDDGVRVIRLENIGDGHFVEKATFIAEAHAGELNRHAVGAGDIVIASLGVQLPKACIVPPHIGRAIVKADCIKLRVDPGVSSPIFVLRWLNSWMLREKVAKEIQGVGRPRLNLRNIRAFEVPLPPLNEQQRIVERIETLFARLDKGEEAIRDVQKLLNRNRQSVLKAAVTGDLTADWRAERQGKLEHGRDLLARILKARREEWQGRGKYKEPVPPETSDLPDLPDGWVWASVEEILREGLSNGRSVPDAETGSVGFPVLRLTALIDGDIDLTERKIGQWQREDAERFLVQRGDILVSRGNGSLSLVGRGGLVAGAVDPVAFPDTMVRIPINVNFLSAIWFVQLWNSPFMRRQIEGAAKTTAGIHKVNQRDLGSLVIPLPTLDEQDKIASIVAGEAEKASLLEGLCTAELARSVALRQSILREAFAGRLVSHDPDDESAGELLARIAAERTSKPKAKRRRRSAA